MGRLTGKVAIVTGAARGMGAEEARHLVAEGARVVATDVEIPEGDGFAALGDAVRFQILDVRDAAQWAVVVDGVEAAFGPVSVLVNNAGIVAAGGVQTMDEATFRRLLDINTVGVFLGMRAVVPSMRRAGGGSIVNISSTSGMRGNTRAIGYTASKWAVRGMSKSAALELAPLGIRVNSVHPGLVDTAMTRGMGIDLPPIGRIGEPIDVARLVGFLASDDSGYITGTEHVIDGGELAGPPPPS